MQGAHHFLGVVLKGGPKDLTWFALRRSMYFDGPATSCIPLPGPVFTL